MWQEILQQLLEKETSMKRVLKYAGRLLVLLCALYIGKMFWSYRNEIINMLDLSHIPSFLGYIGVWGMIYGLLSFFPFLWCLGVFSSQKISAVKVMYTLDKCNLYKYLPGNVWHYVARNQLAEVYSIKHVAVAFCSVLDIVMPAVAALGIAFCLAGGSAWQWISEKGYLRMLLTAVGIALIVLILVVFFLWKRKKEWLTRTVKLVMEYFRRLLVPVLFGIGIWTVILLINSLLFLWILQLLGAAVPPAMIGGILGLCSLAWLLGMITPGVPGGIGVREAVLCYFFASFLSEEVVVLAAIMFRLVTVLGDCVAFFIAWCVQWGEKRYRLRKEP